MAKITTIIARKIHLNLFHKVAVLLVLGLVGLTALLYRVEHGDPSVHRVVDQVVIVSKSGNFGHAGQINNTDAMIKTTPHVPISLVQQYPIGARPTASPLNLSAMTDLDALFGRLVIVTAVSENHVKEALGMIASAQRFMPDVPIYLYDLGLKNETYQRLSSVCGVHIRGFDFSKYPPHVRSLYTYTWKVIIMRETLREFGVIFYGDSSVRFKGTLRALFPFLHRNDGYMFHVHGFDPKVPQKIRHQYFFTHPDMFAELGVDRARYFSSNGAAPHISAGRVLIVNNTVIWEKILDPLLECAMRVECIAPVGSRYGTHRFDASALAILVYKNLRYKWTEENNNSKEFDAIVEIVRKTGGAGIKYCAKNDPR